jgi:predicted  nucleic acid-binding Zn-ribbon protein
MEPVELESELDHLETAVRLQESHLAELTRRIFALETRQKDVDDGNA